MPTIRQKRAVQKIIENPGSVSAAMRAVGYSENTAKNPSDLTNSKGYKEVAKPFLEQLDNEIQAAMDHLPKVRDKAAYGETVSSIEKLKKLKELLSGNSTENNNITITWK